jgi:hypothetical protein
MAATEAHSALGVMSVSRGRTLWMACVAHALHDGYTDLIYLLLPIWQAEFGLGYGVLALLKRRLRLRSQIYGSKTLSAIGLASGRSNAGAYKW